jgi:hypothetical protein
MAGGRIRTLKPEILSDERTAGLSDPAWRLFVSMIVLADDFGNLRAQARLLVSEVWWMRPDPEGVPIRDLLDELARPGPEGEPGLITIYRVRGQSYVHLNGWPKNQRVEKPGRPWVPGPSEADPANGTTPTTEVPHTRRATDLGKPPTLSDKFSTDLGSRIEDQDQGGGSGHARARVTPTGTASGDPSSTAQGVGRNASTSTGTPTQAGLIDWTLDAFRAAWERRYGVEYSPTPGDRTQLGRYLQHLSRERIRQLPVCFLRYLADTDKFIAEKKRHGLGWFLHEDGANKYAVEPGPVISERNARNAEAGRRFLARVEASAAKEAK